MHWGRRKKSSSSSNSSPTLSSSLSHVFPISWLSKFKHMGTKSKFQSSKTKLKPKPISSHSPLFSPLIFKDTQFYDGDVEGDDINAYWQLSFGRDTSNSHVGKHGNGRSSVKSFWDDSDEDDDDELEIPKNDNGKFNDMVSDIRKRRDLEGKDRKFKNQKATTTVRTPELEPIVTIRTPEKEFYRSFAPSDSTKLNYISSSNGENLEGRRRRRISKHHPDHISEEKHEVVSDEEAIREVKKTKEHEKQRKSLYLSRELQKRRSKQSGKVRAYSPRTPSKMEICKIRALEDLKKANKAKKKKAITGDEKLPPLESFAVVKCSFDPEKDFKDSMMEMITENGIKRPEELENLLASYLSLNSDQYHDLIIKVFQQVWLEMNQLCSSPELPKNENSCCSDY